MSRSSGSRAIANNNRDYDAMLMPLKHHNPTEKIPMVMNSPDSLVKKPEYAEALNRHHVEVERWSFLDSENPHAEADDRTAR